MKVYDAVRAGHIDAVDLSFPNLIDTIVFTMKRHGLLAPLVQVLEDKRRDNHHIPFDILLALAVTAKLKLKTSLTDVPFAVNDAELLEEPGTERIGYGPGYQRWAVLRERDAQAGS